MDSRLRDTALHRQRQDTATGAHQRDCPTANRKMALTAEQVWQVMGANEGDN
ncbi:MAG: hypothetical protein HC916_15655 [Coleofasciculaceae cyanobacterium SM2_1_6]|nr:hypothetical protein [Coleofasciculaceae cyanobacterium SM2_1_6]